MGTVASYEVALRIELAKLQNAGRPNSFIIDIRSTDPQAPEVADALRLVVARLGSLHADRTAVVTSSGLAKLQAKRVADVHAQVFTSMVLARDWATGAVVGAEGFRTVTVHDDPSEAEAEGPAVHVHGPSGVDITFTPTAALETARRIGDAAVEALIEIAERGPSSDRRAA